MTNCFLCSQSLNLFEELTFGEHLDYSNVAKLDPLLPEFHRLLSPYREMKLKRLLCLLLDNVLRCCSKSCSEQKGAECSRQFHLGCLLYGSGFGYCLSSRARRAASENKVEEELAWNWHVPYPYRDESLFHEESSKQMTVLWRRGINEIFLRPGKLDAAKVYLWLVEVLFLAPLSFTSFQSGRHVTVVPMCDAQEGGDNWKKVMLLWELKISVCLELEYHGPGAQDLVGSRPGHPYPCMGFVGVVDGPVRKFLRMPSSVSQPIYTFPVCRGWSELSEPEYECQRSHANTSRKIPLTFFNDEFYPSLRKNQNLFLSGSNQGTGEVGIGCWYGNYEENGQQCSCRGLLSSSECFFCNNVIEELFDRLPCANGFFQAHKIAELQNANEVLNPNAFRMLPLRFAQRSRPSDLVSESKSLPLSESDEASDSQESSCEEEKEFSFDNEEANQIHIAPSSSSANIEIANEPVAPQQDGGLGGLADVAVSLKRAAEFLESPDRLQRVAEFRKAADRAAEALRECSVHLDALFSFS